MSVDYGARKKADEGAVLETEDAFAEADRIIELRARHVDLGIALMRLEHDVVGSGELVGHPQVARLEQDAIDDDVVGTAHRREHIMRAHHRVSSFAAGVRQDPPLSANDGGKRAPPQVAARSYP